MTWCGGHVKVERIQGSWVHALNKVGVHVCEVVSRVCSCN